MNDQRKIFVFDIDGTLANIEHRRHFVRTKPKNWPAFNAGMIHDEPYHDIIWLLETFAALGHFVVIASGRGEEERGPTTEWIRNNIDATIYEIYMRPAKDYRADNIIKAEILKQIRRDFGEPFMVFDDRNQVVDMWRANGIRCLQVAPGDF